MLTEKKQVKVRNGFWHELLDGWINVLTQPNIDTFHALKKQADSLKIFVGVGFLGIVLGLWALATKPASLVSGAGDAVLIDLLRMIFFTEADFFIISLILFLVAQAFGGDGNFIQHSYLLSLVTVPMGMIVTAFLFVGDKLGLTLTAILNPLSPIGIAGIFLVLFGIYGFVLLLFALQAAHEKMQSSAILYTLGMPIIIWALLRVASMFAAGEENTITAQWDFIAGQWAKGAAQELLFGHLWLVAFSVAIAVVLGVVMGIFITMPSRRPQFSHLGVLIPLALFLLLWAASSGVLGEEISGTIASTVKGWDRSLRVEGFFSTLVDIVGSIVSKPAAVGTIGAVFTIILYVLFLAGESGGELTLYIAGIILTIPSVALFGVMIKPLGIGPFNAIFALVLYAQLPILRNTYTGIKSVAPEIIESGRGMGMNELQLLLKVKLPMAVPVIMTGVRVAIVMLVGITAIAAYIGNDTLGEYIFSGIQRAQPKRYYAGAILVAILALAVDYFLGWLQDVLTPEGLKGRRETA
ncbi:MAG: ABC transporter permease [Chloroflexota bacterium]|nr:ABC transporter permease [Chloroflexota bacterium]